MAYDYGSVEGNKQVNAPIFDVAIIGGGPAGCSAGIIAASSGLQTILFEAHTYPQDKLCGEFLSPECSGIFDELGARGSILNKRPHPITRSILTAPDGFAWRASLPGTAWGFSRKSLDALLAERARAAGVVIQAGVTVEQVHGSLNEGFNLEARSASGRFITAARTVIAAYGKRSALDRTFNRRFMQRRQPFVAFKAHFTDVPLPGQIQLHAFKGGYCGLSMIEENFAQEPVTNVCFLARSEVFQASRQAGQKPLETFLRWMHSQNPHLQDHLCQGRQLDREWISIAQVPFTPKSPLEGDLLMAGDAAGLIVPLAGDGISIALRSGMLAAGLIFSFLDKNLSPSWLRRTYSRTWKQNFRQRLVFGRVLQNFMLHPGMLSAGLHLIQLYPTLGEYIMTHTREVYQLDSE